ncbi:NAD(P)-binding protein [Xylaria arbuscula]|nr:NAD(P)-binding protein [Xylaria arbuscula]
MTDIAQAEKAASSAWFSAPKSAGDLAGKTAIVTGSSSGIGLECARQLLDRGLSKLILAVRDERKGAVASDDLASGRNLKPDAIEVWHLDYSSYDSITSFADRARDLERLDIVVLNAGVYRIPRVILPTGHEEDIQVNYLSTALLTILLLPILEVKRRPDAQPGRLTVVSSSVAAWSRFKLPQDGRPMLMTLDEPMGTAAFDHHQQYCTSKLLGQLFLTELTRRVPSSVATVTYVHPGLCYGSGLARDGAGTLMGLIAGFIFRIFGRSCVRGARVIVDGAVAHGEEAHGQYLVDKQPAGMAPIVYTAEGRQMAQRLWKETMSELSFAGVEDVIEALSL